MYHCSGKPAPPLLRRWGLNRSLALGAGGFALAWETATGRGLSGRSSASCASLRSLPKAAPAASRTGARDDVPALLPGTKKAPGKIRGPRSRTEELPEVSQLQLLKSLAGLPSRGAVTPDAAPMAEWGRRPSGAIVSLGEGDSGRTWSMEHGFRALRCRATGGGNSPRPPLFVFRLPSHCMPYLLSLDKGVMLRLLG